MYPISKAVYSTIPIKSSLFKYAFGQKKVHCEHCYDKIIIIICCISISHTMLISTYGWVYPALIYWVKILCAVLRIASEQGDDDRKYSDIT